MVEWKGDTTEKAGGKAQRLDRLESFNVPNFFVITSEEVKQLFNGETQPERVLNSSLDQRIEERIEEAYQDVGMSSEVRKASGKARNLVGGQRNNQFVSIRVSNSKKEKYTYKLNVGASNFFDALKQVVSSYTKHESEHPSVIVQKMVEPGYTGTLENHGMRTVVETVKGLGISLEEGLTTPSTYLMSQGRVEDVFTPDEQLEISRNPVHGDNQRRKIVVDERPFDDSEIKSLAGKASRMGVNLKFVYKRGSFHIIDAYDTSNEDPVITEEGIRASKGEIQGTVGREVSFSEQTVPPEEFQEGAVCKTGAYTSRDGYKIREAGKPAVFQSGDELEKGQRINLGPEDVTVSRDTENTASLKNTGSGVNPFKQESVEASGLASEVLPVDPRVGRGVCVERHSNQGYVVTETETEAVGIPQEAYISSYQDFFTFNSDRVIVDVRRLQREGLEDAIGYVDADLKILIVDEPTREQVRHGVENGFDVFAADEDNLEALKDAVESEEKRFIMQRLRELE